MNYSGLLQLTKGWGNFKFYRITIWRLQSVLNNYAGLEDLLSFLLLLCSDKINGISGQIFNLDSRI